MDMKGVLKPSILGQTLGSPLGKNCQFMFPKIWFSSKSPLLKFFQGICRSCRIVSRIFCLTFRTPPFLPQANCSGAFFLNTNFSFHVLHLSRCPLNTPNCSYFYVIVQKCPPMVLPRSSHLMRFFYSPPKVWLKPCSPKETSQPSSLQRSLLPENSQCFLLSG